MSRRTKRTDIIDAIAIAAPASRVLDAIAPDAEPAVIIRFHRAGAEPWARFAVEQRTPAGLALVCVDDTTGLAWAGTRLHLAIVPANDGVRVALVHAGTPAKGYALGIDAWRSFLVELKDQLEAA